MMRTMMRGAHYSAGWHCPSAVLAVSTLSEVVTWANHPEWEQRST